MQKDGYSQEEIETESLSDAENFIRRKIAEYISWEKKYHDYLVEYGMYTKVKIKTELVIEEPHKKE